MLTSLITSISIEKLSTLIREAPSLTIAKNHPKVLLDEYELFGGQHGFRPILTSGRFGSFPLRHSGQRLLEEFVTGTINLPLRQLNGSNSLRQLIGSNF